MDMTDGSCFYCERNDNERHLFLDENEDRDVTSDPEGYWRRQTRRSTELKQLVLEDMRRVAFEKDVLLLETAKINHDGIFLIGFGKSFGTFSRSLKELKVRMVVLVDPWLEKDQMQAFAGVPTSVFWSEDAHEKADKDLLAAFSAISSVTMTVMMNVKAACLNDMAELDSFDTCMKTRGVMGIVSFRSLGQMPRALAWLALRDFAQITDKKSNQKVLDESAGNAADHQLFILQQNSDVQFKKID